ncbi:MAG TPA: hypothetical protein VFX60_04305, partial [Micromonospora sp.]|nr:hypothetical protein [Micromonospora sp.]
LDVGIAVAGPSGSGVVAAGYYNDLGWPLGIHVAALDDGTVFSLHDDGSAWLGTGPMAERRWIKVVLHRG